MRRAIATFAVLAIILMAGVGAISAQYNTSVTESTNETAVVNESFTADLGTAVALDESNRDVVYNDTVTVYNSSTVLVEQDGNYTWHAGNGTLRINASTGQFSQGESGTVSYNYTVPTEEQRVVRDVALIIPGTLGDTIMLIMGLVILLSGLVVLNNQR